MNGGEKSLMGTPLYPRGLWDFHPLKTSLEYSISTLEDIAIATSEDGMVVLFMILILSDLLLPQELEAFINEMPSFLAVVAELSLVMASPMST